MEDNHARDYRNQPAYTISEASRYLRIPTTTLRSWVSGRSYTTVNDGSQRTTALIKPAAADPVRLSFWNLIEAYVLASLRVDFSVPIKAVRTALDYAGRELGIDRLLLHEKLCTADGAIFLERYGELLQLSASGQIALKTAFMARLRHIEWDEWQYPLRLHPQLATEGLPSAFQITIDPGVSFGRPVIRRLGVRTEALAERIDLGESLEAVAADYDLSIDEMRAAIQYEHAA